MKKILLICTSGLTTNMLVYQMKRVVDCREVEIWAVGEPDKMDHIPKADIILLAPQIRYMKPIIDDIVKGKKPVMLVDAQSFGAMDGKKILEDALEILK